MSIEQYQRDVNSIDKEIATLEKKKAEIMIYKLQNIKLWQKQKKQIS